ncbi:MAG: ATP-grasp domain-containing protein, partial [Bacteroidales bacterium]|nr:ATP-grasp domain-containing protein [Bacteroidales bacterium]
MDDLEKQFDEAVKLSKSKTVIVEEFNEGKELSVDFYVEGKQAKLLCVTNSNKIKNNNDSFTILQSFYPAVSVEEEAKITSIAQKIVDAFALYDMPLLVQMIENKGIYNVVEFSARMGGGSKTSLIKVLTGVDMISVFTNRILGEKSSVNPQKLINYATMNYVYCHSGVFAEIKNFYELQKENIIREYYVYKYPGTFISKHETSSDRAAGYLLISENQEEMNDKLKHANRELQILDEHGKDMMMHDLL